jgi:hypothetical protein
MQPFWRRSPWGHDAEAREALRRYLALPSTGPLKTVAAFKAYFSAQGGGAARVCVTASEAQSDCARSGTGSLTIVRIDVRLRNRRLIAAKLSLNGLAEVLQQMKTIGDLPRLRRAVTRGLSIEASTIAADHLHLRVTLTWGASGQG